MRVSVIFNKLPKRAFRAKLYYVSQNRAAMRVGAASPGTREGVEGVAEFIGYEQLTTIDELRSGMTFPSCHRFRTTAGSVSGSFSISRSFGAFQKLSVSTTKRKHNGEDTANFKRSR